MKNFSKLFLLELIFLSLTFTFIGDSSGLIGPNFRILGFNFNVLFGAGAGASVLSTSVIGMIFAIMHNRELGENGNKWSVLLAGIGIAVFCLESLKWFIPMDVQIMFNPGVILIAIDLYNHFQMNKKAKSNPS